MSWMLNAGLALGALVAMEGVACLAHRHVMHGFLWCWHESHHRPRTGIFERNDLFALVFSMPSILFIFLGTHGHPPLLWLGIGIAGYGLVYFLFHDVIVHRRTWLRWKPGGRYMKRIVQAHWIHHATHDKEGAVSFGFIYSPPIEKLRSEQARLRAGCAAGRA